MDLILDWREIGGESDASEAGRPREYTRIFRALARDASVRSWQVKAFRLCPKRYEYDRAGGGYVRGVTAVRDSQRLRLFTITVVYQEDLPEEPDDDPLRRPASVASKGIDRSVPAIEDWDGNPLVNTAGDLITGVMVDEPGVVFTITKNVAAKPQPWLLNLANYYNLDAFRVDGLACKPGTLLIRQPQIGHVTTDNDIDYRVAQFELHYNRRGWEHLKLWNRGFHEVVEERVLNLRTGRSEVTRQKVRILDDRGEPISEPQFIDERGQRFLAAGPDGVYRIKHPLSRDDLRRAVLTFKIRGGVKFNSLPLA